MKKILFTSMILGAAVMTFSGFSGCHATTSSQEKKAGDEAAVKIDNSEARKVQIITNLKAKYPSLAMLDPQLADFKQVTPGMQSVEMSLQTPQGAQKQTLLLTPDNKALYMIIEGPIDVSRDAKSIADDQAKEKRERSTALAGAIAGVKARGDEKAPVTIIEFTDFQCPYCSRGYATLEEAIKKYEGKVKVIYMPFPLPFHPWAKPAAIAAACAEQQSQEALWALYHGFFDNQKDITPENLKEKSVEFLKTQKIDAKAWDTCFSDESNDAHKKAVKHVDDSMAAGSAQGVNGTPAFFINGEMLNGALPLPAFSQAIDKALGGSGDAVKPADGKNLPQ